MHQYMIAPPELDHQRNALRVEIIPPMARCILLPRTDFAVLTRARFNWRTDQLARIWTHFDYCNQSKNGCAGCPFFHRHQERTSAPANAVVRQDPVNKKVWWILPDSVSGWDRFGYFYSETEQSSGLAKIVRNWAIDIAPERQTDKCGAFYNTVKDQPDYLSVDMLMRRR